MTLLPKLRFTILDPNHLSVLRGIIGACLPFLILSPGPAIHLAAFVLFVIGAVTDYWDGWIARQYKLESAFGKWVDPFMDKILILAPLAAFANLGFFSLWWLVPIFAREIVVTFCRTAWLLEGKSFGAEKLGKLKFVFQTGSACLAFAIFVLWDYASTASLSRWLAPALKPVLAITLVLTLFSGFSFLWNQREHFSSQHFCKVVLAAGVGLLPKAPGTWGSLVGVLFVLLTAWNTWLYLGVLGFVAVAGELAFRRLEDKTDPDPQFVVVDEAAGIMVTFALIPVTWITIPLGFLLFRLFDVKKPFPIKSLERIPGYWGIMADDIGAGFYAWIILFLFFA
ncbi:MAG: CDP-diacylglycerol--glycerol-3-phosphate 3-phosphatidyltransferase [Candidatus Omnitrophica bacterium ADurb.Bin277]|nr:MAG: CDP-diacylglycerol--glycerol-3-phosphate 3-phosphatidyltransferase [Candidatus Omnitrophica bacterium ADurb.Bin277]